ncbi:HIT domain-containing protein [Patescibacteria group bacterium]|nr:HIT domain-containing protein [Patescibacteria group bacterium]
MQLSHRLKGILIGLVFIGIGIVIGGYLFADTQPRSFLAFQRCEETCLNPNELVGLLTSVGIQKFPAAISPFIIRESDKTLVVKHPVPLAELHYVVIPKIDIKDAADLTEKDQEYLIDSYAVMADIIKEKGLFDYKIITNGPGFQTMGYFHFHLVSDLP